jgi:hypothetical protein
MKYIIQLIIFYAAIGFAQDKNPTEQIIDHLSTWRPVTVEQVKISLQNQQAKENLSSMRLNVLSNITIEKNLSQIVQVGNYNNAKITQNGEDNIALIKQMGDFNSYTGSQDGIDLLTYSEQLGDFNSIIQELRGNNLNYVLIQKGNNNDILQVENSHSLFKEYQVVQRGEGLRLIIINGNFPVQLK